MVKGCAAQRHEVIMLYRPMSHLSHPLGEQVRC